MRRLLRRLLRRPPPDPFEEADRIAAARAHELELKVHTLEPGS